MTRLYILDLDRTIFNTHRFGRDLITFMERAFDLDPAVFETAMHRYALPSEMGYDFYTHATAATGRSGDEIHQLVGSHFAGSDYTYPDVEPWLARHTSDQVLIATVGEFKFQTLKFEFAASLSNLPRVIVGENKGTLVRQALSDPSQDQLNLKAIPHSQLTLVDDNPATFAELGPLPAVEQFYLSRPSEKFSGQPVASHAITITSLEELL